MPRLPVAAFAIAATAACLTVAGCGVPSPPDRIDPGLDPASLDLPADGGQIRPELPDGIDVRVGSYNIFSGRIADPEAIGAAIAGLGLDLIGLQECPEEMVETVARAAGYDHFGGSGVALLSRTPYDRFDLVPLRTGRSFIRAGTTIGGAPFAVYVIHLGWNVEGDTQFREFTDEHLALETNPRLLLMGDFNDEHYSSQLTIVEQVVTDVFTAAGLYPGERISWPSTGSDDTEGSQLIDLICFRTAFPPIVIETFVHNLAPVRSDHKPVSARLLFPPGDEPFGADPLAAGRDPWRVLPPEGERPPNRLLNPGAEDGLTGWVVTGGGTAVAERQHQLPRTGNRLFTGFSGPPEGDAGGSSGSQTVDLSDLAGEIDGRQARLYASGFLATGYQTEERDGIVSNIPKPYDEGEVTVEPLDSTGRPLDGWTSKRRDTLAWHPFVLAGDLPPGARSARLTWISHHKPGNGDGNDAVFDDLSLSAGTLDLPHPALAGNLLANPGGEAGATGGWTATGWQALPTGRAHGLTFFPPHSFSGGWFFWAGGRLGVEGGIPGRSVLRQAVDLAAFRRTIDAGRLALRWGGWLRTWQANTRVAIELEIVDRDGTVWAVIPGGELADAEWRPVERLTRIPPGASGVALVVAADCEQNGTAALADGLYLRPEEVDRPVGR